MALGRGTAEAGQKRGEIHPGQTESGRKLSLVPHGEAKPLLIVQGNGSQSFMCLRISWRDYYTCQGWGGKPSGRGVCDGTLEPAL